MDSKNKIVVFRPSDEGEFEVVLDNRNETFLATEKEISQLFKRDRSVISKHLKNIFTEGEFNKNEVCANFVHTATDGKTYQVSNNKSN